jgi:spoIIIJ-associated protein
LGLSQDDVEVEVVDQGSRGLLGLGARDAVVRLTAIQREPPASPETPPAPTVPEPPAEAKEPEMAEPEPEDEEEEREQEDIGTDEFAWSEDQVAETARQTVSELLDQMGFAAQVTVRPPETSADGEPAPLTLDIGGDDLNSLIGRQGEVLNALQYISRLIVSREVEHWVNLVVDVQHYKRRRSRSLRELAGRIAERVARTNQPVALEPMPPNERRAIHIALRDHPSVTTQSVGRGDKRKVTIIPKR